MHFNEIVDNIILLTNRLQKKTIEITFLLSRYDIENSPHNILSELIEKRNKLVHEIQTQNKRLNKIIGKNDPHFQVKLIDITSKLDEIIKQDKINQTSIANLQNRVLTKSSCIKKGKKFINGYNIFPRRKSLFVDIAVTQ